MELQKVISKTKDLKTNEIKKKKSKWKKGSGVFLCVK